MRRKAFYQNLEISRSIEVLKNDLESKNVDAGIVGLAQEMVEKKGEVQNALMIRDGFISMASHELRTPLTSMKLQMDLVKMKLINSQYSQEEVLKHHTNAYRQINSIVHLVDEMLDVSRIQSGKFVIEKEYFDLNELVKEIIERNYSSHSSKIKLSLENVPLKGNWDPFKIEQVIVNLINNAFRYGGEGMVSVATQKRGSMATLTVSDKGPGIPPGDLQKIFEKFERGKDTKSGGLGLGLFISKEIAENHGGSLTVQSKEGEGASFTLQLPL
jgi:signal transduction histidine kinase